MPEKKHENDRKYISHSPSNISPLGIFITRFLVFFDKNIFGWSGEAESKDSPLVRLHTCAAFSKTLCSFTWSWVTFLSRYSIRFGDFESDRPLYSRSGSLDILLVSSLSLSNFVVEAISVVSKRDLGLSIPTVFWGLELATIKIHPLWSN